MWTMQNLFAIKSRRRSAWWRWSAKIRSRARQESRKARLGAGPVAVGSGTMIKMTRALPVTTNPRIMAIESGATQGRRLGPSAMRHLLRCSARCESCALLWSSRQSPRRTPSPKSTLCATSLRHCRWNSHKNLRQTPMTPMCLPSKRRSRIFARSWPRAARTAPARPSRRSSVSRKNSKGCAPKPAAGRCNMGRPRCSRRCSFNSSSRACK
mmetsp:Transcript_21805/g.66196  ORF Transcript_21805/g.66196 Transcript_21805/m.66196 type:complete len:211 (+) Transcript_21805:739-1371(+)